jgi:hypothetical protein
MASRIILCAVPSKYTGRAFQEAASADAGEVVLELESFDSALLWKDTCQQAAQFGIIPLTGWNRRKGCWLGSTRR